MKYCSLPCGSKASTAKYHSKYQSGRGVAAIMLGSGGFPNCGAPKYNASAAMATIIPTQKTVSRHAASGQNGRPFFSISSLYSWR